VQSLVTRIATVSAQQSSHTVPSLSALTEDFNSLLSDYKDEYLSLALDEVVVGAIAQVVSVLHPLSGV
jgi:tuftelin-interacting protein 11